MKLTHHFALHEFACKDGTPYPREWIEEWLRPLCCVLERLRTHFGSRPITIVSGYRTPEYNRKVGGAKNSQHLYGRAADIAVSGPTADQVHDSVLQLYRDGKLPSIGGLGSYPNFTHIDIRPTKRLVRWSGTRDVA